MKNSATTEQKDAGRTEFSQPNRNLGVDEQIAVQPSRITNPGIA
jgi:hypothetical protein